MLCASNKKIAEGMRLGIEKVFIWYLMIIINEYYASFLNIAKIMTYIVNIGNVFNQHLNHWLGILFCDQ